jgi:hypothetical protein
MGEFVGSTDKHTQLNGQKERWGETIEEYSESPSRLEQPHLWRKEATPRKAVAPPGYE